MTNLKCFFCNKSLNFYVFSHEDIPNLLSLNQDERLPFLQLDDNQFNELQNFSSARIAQCIKSYRSFPHLVQIGLKDVCQLEDRLFLNLVWLKSDQMAQLTTLPFPKIKEFLTLPYHIRGFKLPSDLDQFKSYRGENIQ